MSYILDALRRAESERDRGRVPGLNAQPAPGPTTATPTRPIAVVPVLALGLGLLLLAGLAWWAWPRGTVPTPASVPANGGAAATAVLRRGKLFRAGPQLGALEADAEQRRFRHPCLGRISGIADGTLGEPRIGAMAVVVGAGRMGG